MFLLFPPRSDKRVEHIEYFIVKAAAHHRVVEHGEVAAGDHNERPDHAEHQIDVHKAGNAAYAPAQPVVHRTDHGQLVHQPQHCDQQADQHPQQGKRHKEQHQRDHRGQQRSQHLLDDGIRQHNGVVIEDGRDGALAGIHDGCPERLGQKARVPLGNAIQTDGSPGGDIGSDLVPEASGEEALEHLPGCPARKGSGTEQADEAARQLHHRGQKAFAGIPDGQHQPDHRT